MSRFALVVTGLVLALAVLSGCSAVRPAPASDDLSIPEGAAGIRRVGSLVLDGVPPIPPRISERFRQYSNTRSAVFLGWLDGGILLTTRFGETYQLHRVREPMGAREQITFFDEPVMAAFPPTASGAAGLVYSRDAGGSEFYQLFWLDWDTGESRLLTDGKSRYDAVLWTNAADRFAYTTTERDGRSWDVHLQDLAGNRSVAFESDAGVWAPLDFAPADDRLLVGQYLSATESSIHELNLESGELTPLLDPSIHAATADARYAPDGRGVYFTSDLGAEFLRLHRMDPDSGRIEVLTAEVPWDVETFEISPDGAYLALVVNEGGASRLSVKRVADGSMVALPEVPLGIISNLAFAPDSTKLGFSLSLPTSPTDVFSIDLDARKLTRWTRSEVGGLDTARFVVPEVFDYPTFDEVNGQQRRIPALIYRPAGPGPHPVVISIHGGPEAQARPYFSPTSQYLANELGVAVIVPNVRGSRGYGKSYVSLDNGYLREDSVRDIGALLDWIAVEPELDQHSVAVIGGSYGGYMVLASMVHYGDRLAAGIGQVGISNFVTFLTNTEDYRRDLRRVEYGDERDPEMRSFLERISPLNNAHRINKPLMISQGYNDPRVPSSESEQIVAALKGSGVPVWYVLALDEGHGFRKKPNADFNADATMLFIERYLLGD